MATRIGEAEAVEGWEPVPPGHPDRAVFEDRMRAFGIRPATRWEPRRGRRVFKKPGWREWLRARLGL